MSLNQWKLCYYKMRESNNDLNKFVRGNKVIGSKNCLSNYKNYNFFFIFSKYFNFTLKQNWIKFTSISDVPECVFVLKCFQN